MSRRGRVDNVAETSPDSELMVTTVLVDDCGLSSMVMRPTLGGSGYPHARNGLTVGKIRQHNRADYRQNQLAGPVGVVGSANS